MQHKTLQALLASASPQQNASPEAELLAPELAAQLKSGRVHAHEEALAPWPPERWPLLAAWRYRLREALARLGPAE